MSTFGDGSGSPRRGVPGALAWLAALALLAPPGCGPAPRAAPRVEYVEPPEPELPVLDFPDPIPPDAARRIVSLVPSCTETLFALGLGERLIGVDRWADFPPEVAELPRLGDYNAVHTERILDLAPDLVVLFRGQETAGEALRLAGIPVLIARTIAPQEILPGLIDVARAAGVPERGERLVAKLEAELAGVAKESTSDSPPRVLVVFERHPGVSVATRSSFVHRLLQIAGAVNVSADADSERGFTYVRLEQVQDWEPDVILDLTVTNGSPEGLAEARAFWALAWPDEVLVRLVDCPPLSRPGPRMGACARILAELVR